MPGILTSILILLACALAVLLAMAASKPNTFRVERSIHIRASRDTIFSEINDLARWNAWSPWAKKDPAMKQTISAVSAGTGAWQAWEGNSQVGSGRMEITESVHPARVAIKLNFLKPFKAENTGLLHLKEDGDSTQVIWSMEGPAPLISKVMDTLFNMDKMIGRDFEAGLANLKGLTER